MKEESQQPDGQTHVKEKSQRRINTLCSAIGTATSVIPRQRNKCCSPAGITLFFIPWQEIDSTEHVPSV